MKAKYLSELLLQYPEAEVIFVDCEDGTTKISGVDLVKLDHEDIAYSFAELEVMKKNASFFTSQNILIEYENLIRCEINDGLTKEAAIESWGTFEQYLETMTDLKDRLETQIKSCEKAEFTLQLVSR